MSCVCSYTTGHWVEAAGTTCRVHFTAACDILEGEGHTIRTIETAEEAFADVICNKCFVDRNAVIYFETNTLLQRKPWAFLNVNTKQYI